MSVSESIGQDRREGERPGSKALPGLPGYDPSSAPPETLHALDEAVRRLSRRWWRFPPVAAAAEQHGVSLVEAVEYQYVGDLLRTLIARQRPVAPRRPSPG